MKLEKLKKLIVKDLSDIFDLKEEKRCFKDDIFFSKDIWEVLIILEQYGWDRQGALDIIFKHSIQE